jgi:hypothetical protein
MADLCELLIPLLLTIHYNDETVITLRTTTLSLCNTIAACDVNTQTRDGKGERKGGSKVQRPNFIIMKGLNLLLHFYLCNNTALYNQPS